MINGLMDTFGRIILVIIVLWSTAFLACDPIAQGAPLEDAPSPHSV